MTDALDGKKAGAGKKAGNAPRPPRRHDGLPIPRRYWSVAAILLSISMAVLDGSIANVALPTIAKDLNASAASSIWIVNAYQLAITICLLPLAALGDKIGYRRVYMAGLAVFTFGSLACALSGSLEVLTIARIVQGVGAAGIMSMNSALVRFTYPQSMLGRGIGLNAVVIAIAAAVGPTVASAILATTTWHWLFAINLPLGIIAIAIGVAALPRTIGSGKSFDLISAVLSAIAFGFLILGAEGLARDASAVAWVELAIGAVATALLTVREWPRPAPLVPFDLLRIPLFGLSAACSVVAFAAQMLALVALPFHFQQVLHRSAVETGFLLTPMPLAVGVMAPIAGRLSDRLPVGGLGAFGMAVFAAGLALLALLPADASTADILWRVAVCGAGFGFFQSPNNRAMLSSSPLERSGAAGGALSTARLLGQTSGAVSMAAFFHLAGAKATGLALATAAGIAGVAAVISFVRPRMTTAPKPAPEARSGDQV
jgi:DHA2 family multidrug resistance protein-like MFS transporter